MHVRRKHFVLEMMKRSMRMALLDLDSKIDELDGYAGGTSVPSLGMLAIANCSRAVALTVPVAVGA